MDIVAYTYRADHYCGDCIVRELGVEPGEVPGSVTAEQVLDVAAHAQGIDREDEWTFDSGDFPKVVLAGQLRSGQDYPLIEKDGGETADRCGRCHTILAP